MKKLSQFVKCRFRVFSSFAELTFGLQKNKNVSFTVMFTLYKARVPLSVERYRVRCIVYADMWGRKVI